MMTMKSFYLWILLLSLQDAMATLTVNEQKRDLSCSYNSATFADDEVVLSLPSKCVQLQCHAGNITTVYFFGEDTCGCCEYNNKLYMDGSQMSGVCARLYCKCGKWYATEHLHDCCNECQVLSVPHIVTFDSSSPLNFYSWTTPCTYTLTQELSSIKFGVYATYQHCPSGICLTDVHFNDESNIVFHISLVDAHLVMINYIVAHEITEHPTNIEALGVTSDIIAWKTNPSCVRILIVEGLLLQICEYEVRMWIHPSLSDNVGGLCGKYNMIEQDDFTDASGVVYPLQHYPAYPDYQFIKSWEAPWLYFIGSCIEETPNNSEDCSIESSGHDVACNELLEYSIHYAAEHGYKVQFTEQLSKAVIETCIIEACKNNLYLVADTKLQAIPVHLFLYSIIVNSQIVGEHDILQINTANMTCSMVEA